MTVPGGWVVIGVAAALALTFGGCDPKPLAELPSLDGKPRPDSTDRTVPGGKTLATALLLLDPRAGDAADLDRQRGDFEHKLVALVPVREDRTRLGFERVLRWHRLYARRLAEYQRLVAAHSERLEKLLQPATGAWLRVDHHGIAMMCRPASDSSAPECRQVPGLQQLQHGVKAIADGASAALEAEWYLLTHLTRLRARLDPDSLNSSEENAAFMPSPGSP